MHAAFYKGLNLKKAIECVCLIFLWKFKIPGTGNILTGFIEIPEKRFCLLRLVYIRKQKKG